MIPEEKIVRESVDEDVRGKQMEEGVATKEMAERGKKLVKDTRQWQENAIDSEFSQSEADFLKKLLFASFIVS